MTYEKVIHRCFFVSATFAHRFVGREWFRAVMDVIRVGRLCSPLLLLLGGLPATTGMGVIRVMGRVNPVWFPGRMMFFVPCGRVIVSTLGFRLVTNSVDLFGRFDTVWSSFLMGDRRIHCRPWCPFIRVCSRIRSVLDRSGVVMSLHLG